VSVREGNTRHAGHIGATRAERVLPNKNLELPSWKEMSRRFCEVGILEISQISLRDVDRMCRLSVSTIARRVIREAFCTVSFKIAFANRTISRAINLQNMSQRRLKNLKCPRIFYDDCSWNYKFLFATNFKVITDNSHVKQTDVSLAAPTIVNSFEETLVAQMSSRLRVQRK